MRSQLKRERSVNQRFPKCAILNMEAKICIGNCQAQVDLVPILISTGNYKMEIVSSGTSVAGGEVNRKNSAGLFR